MIEWLWTDIGFITTLFFIFSYIVISLKNRKTRDTFSKLAQKRPAIVSLVLLTFFILIGLLDSIHIHSGAVSNRTLSLLDHLMAPLNTVHEKTYSAPLALNLYNEEITLINNLPTQVYPRLTYPLRHFNTPIDVQKFVKITLLYGFMMSLLFSGLLFMLYLLIHYIRKKPFKISIKQQAKTLITVFLTILICLFIIIVTYRISRCLHLCGTGKIGQDIFYEAVKSIRTGLVIGTLTSFFMLPFAILLGVTAGFFGGLIDDAIQLIYTVLSSIPGVLLITAAVLSLQTYISTHPEDFISLDKAADARLLALCIILGVTSWTNLCRLLRAETLKWREMDFIQAAKGLGSSSIRIIYKHLLPNMLPIILITVVLDFSFLVLAEAVLSYVGVGVSPMTISWGNMINGARLELAREPIVWWPMATAFVFMLFLVLAVNILADALRDILDPKQQ